MWKFGDGGSDSKNLGGQKERNGKERRKKDGRDRWWRERKKSERIVNKKKMGRGNKGGKTVEWRIWRLSFTCDWVYELRIF
jgi:hypothetical protein